YIKYCLFSVVTLPQSGSSRFPYTTLFRSWGVTGIVPTGPDLSTPINGVAGQPDPRVDVHRLLLRLRPVLLKAPRRCPHRLPPHAPRRRHLPNTLLPHRQPPELPVLDRHHRPAPLPPVRHPRPLIEHRQMSPVQELLRPHLTAPRRHHTVRRRPHRERSELMHHRGHPLLRRLVPPRDTPQPGGHQRGDPLHTELRIPLIRPRLMRGDPHPDLRHLLDQLTVVLKQLRLDP